MSNKATKGTPLIRITTSGRDPTYLGIQLGSSGPIDLPPEGQSLASRVDLLTASTSFLYGLAFGSMYKWVAYGY